MYSEENLDKLKRQAAKSMCCTTLITMACMDVINGNHKRLKTRDLAQVIIGTIYTDYEQMKRLNPSAMKLSEIAVEQILETGQVSEQMPDIGEEE